MTFLVRECYGSPKISIKFIKIRQNSLKFTLEECYDKVLNEEFFKNLFCKMKNVITRNEIILLDTPTILWPSKNKKKKKSWRKRKKKKIKEKEEIEKRKIKEEEKKKRRK
jgi:hypothetical protein